MAWIFFVVSAVLINIYEVIFELHVKYELYWTDENQNNIRQVSVQIPNFMELRWAVSDMKHADGKTQHSCASSFYALGYKERVTYVNNGKEVGFFAMCNLNTNNAKLKQWIYYVQSLQIFVMLQKGVKVKVLIKMRYLCCEIINKTIK
jgi:hypothetical protein